MVRLDAEELNVSKQDVPIDLATVADSRAWWQLSRGEVEQRATALGWRAILPCGSWTRLDWDGRGRIRLDRIHVSRKEVEHLLRELRRLILDHGISVAQLPTMECVRRSQSLDGTMTQLIVIDVDLGEFILPVAASEETLSTGSPYSQIASGMAEVIEFVDGIRDKIIVLELKMRGILSDTAMTSEGGLVPLWLRMCPWDPCIIHLAPPRYHVTAFHIDDDLRWTVSEEVMDDEAEFARFLPSADTLRRRVATEAIIEETGYGLVSDVALGFMNSRDINPRKLFEDLHQARLQGKVGSRKYDRGDTLETLVLNDGVGNVVEERRLAGAGRGHDQAALSFA